MLRKVMIVLVGLALGGTAIQTQAFARDHGGGGDFVRGGGGFGHGGGFSHHGGGHFSGRHFFRGSPFVGDLGVWPYGDDSSYCYWNRYHRYVCPYD